ncbi:MAG: hypothetical protein K0B08_06155 [Bacteroidales bacterium]|nr:hypothetical protein [Bacteroidales bacterium]
MKNITLLAICFLSVLTWQSCQYDWIDPIEPDIPEVVSFSGDIIPIFNNRNCNSSSCHAAGAVPPDLTPANAYNDLFARNHINLATPENSKLYTKCAPGGSMNKYCQPGDWEIMLKWIREGALNN